MLIHHDENEPVLFSLYYIISDEVYDQTFSIYVYYTEDMICFAIPLETAERSHHVFIVTICLTYQHT